MVKKVSQLDEKSSTIMEWIKNPLHLFVEGESMVHKSSQSNIHVQEDIIDIDENKVASIGPNSTITFTSSRPSEENASIKSRQKSGNIVKSKKFQTSLKAKKALCKVKKIHKRYSIDHKGKTKLEHWWGPKSMETILVKRETSVKKLYLKCTTNWKNFKQQQL